MQGHCTPFGVRMSYRCLLFVLGSLLLFANYVIFPAGCSPFSFHTCSHLKIHQASCTEKTAADQQQKGVHPRTRLYNSFANHMVGRRSVESGRGKVTKKRRPWRALERSLASESWNESEEERV